jgi:hypothetical protein
VTVYAGLAAARWEEVATGLGVASVLVVAVGLAKRRAAAIPAGVALAATAYGIAVTSRDPAFDRASIVVAALLLVSAELAFWSLELAAPVRFEPAILTRRVVLIAALGLAALAAAGLVAVAASQAADRSLLLTGLGVAAAVVVAALLTRPGRADGR